MYVTVRERVMRGGRASVYILGVTILLYIL